MRRFLFGFLVVMVLGIDGTLADAVSCQQDYTLQCPFDYGTTGRPPIVQLKDFNCASDPTGPNPVSDTTCWRQALRCARGAGLYQYGTVAATEGVTYAIDDTLCVVSAQDGVIDGNGARLDWRGTSDPMKPIFYFAGVEEMRIQNLTITSNSSHPLHSALMFGTEGDTLVSSQNVVDHVRIEGTNLHGLAYGIRLVGPSSLAGNPLGLIDANNDLFTFQDVVVQNVTKAALSIEHSQSYSHRLIGFEAYAADGDETVPSDDCLNTTRDPNSGECNPQNMIMGASGVRTLGGSFNSIGGFLGGFANTAYFLAALQGPATIVDHHSEACGHLLRTQDGATGASMGVSIRGGRYAADGIAADGRIVDWHRAGPLTLNGLHIDGLTGPGPIKFYLNPDAVGGALNLKGEFEVSHINVYILGSSGWSDIIELANPSKTHLVAFGNICKDASDMAAPCPGLGGGVDQAVAVLKNKDLSDASNQFPTSLATVSGSQSLSNKDLTSTSNVFPGTTLLGFTAIIPGSGTKFIGPGTAAMGTIEASVGFAAPRFVVTRLACGATVAPGASRSWTMTLRSGGTDTALTCAITGSATTCSQSPSQSVTLVAGAPLSLRIVGTGSGSFPATGYVGCAVTAGP